MPIKKWDNYKEITNKILAQDPQLKNYETQYDIYQLMYDLADSIHLEKSLYDDARKYHLKVLDYVHRCAAFQAGQTGDERFEELYWQCLLLEAPWVFESYLRYMEKNREPSRRFYEPRNKRLKLLVDELQALEDGKYKFLGISLPPRVGKLISDDTPVLTENGWKNHGDLAVGDRVYDNDGQFVRVTHVFPKAYADKRVHFSDGSYIDCHRNHEWIVFDKHKQRERIAETHELEEGIREGHDVSYAIPHHGAEIIAIEDIEPKSGNCISVEGGVYRVGRRCVPTHNSTLCIFFLSWIMGKRPNSHNAMSGHSGILADGFYGEALNLISTEEYTFAQIFPRSKLQRKSADKKEINLGKADRFATLTCRGIDGTWTGAVDISSDGYLYVDDLVRDRIESLSPTRLENRYQDYLNVLVDRKNDGSRELMVGTRWNVLDPLGRIEAAKKNDPLYRFVKIPALDENGESNFQYDYGVGFSTEYFTEIKSRLDANEWQAKYQQNPFVREGLLFPVDELRTYNGVLPEGDSKVIAACDVAWGGGDSLSMPIGREYENGEIYIIDWVFNKGKKEETLPLVTGQIINNEIRQVRFEGNTGGDLYAKYVDERLVNEHNYHCSCTSKKAPTKMAKIEKIIAYSGDIKRRFIFLDEEHRSQEYKDAMEELCMTVSVGKNEHDDAADGLTQLAMFANGDGTRKQAIIMDSFF